MTLDPAKPLLNRAIMGQYPPGSTFKTGQAITYYSEGIINDSTRYPCPHGFSFKGLHVGCHSHASPISLVPALSTSCNAYFCWGLYHMLSNRQRYKTLDGAMNRWRDYMVSMGFGYKLGIDLPGEKRGMIPNANFYNNAFGKWNALSVISISIGQGEVNLTPLQIANLGAIIANRGYYYTPHVVRKIQGHRLDKEYLTKHKAIAVYVENGGFGAVYGVPIGSLMMEQYINGKLTPGDAAKAEAIQKRHISYPFKRPLSKADSLRLDSIKRVNQIKDSLKMEREKQKMEETAKEKELKAKRDAEKKEKEQQPLNDPAIRVDEEVKIKSERDEKDKDKDNANGGKKRESDSKPKSP